MNPIKIDKTRDELFTEEGSVLMKNYYMKDGDTSPQDALARAAYAYSYGDADFAQRIYDYVSKGWFFFASPVLSNAPDGEWKEEAAESSTTREFWEENSDDVRRSMWKGEIPKAMPISCFLMDYPDNIKGQVDAAAELANLSIMGGGVGAHNNIRAVSEKAPGPIPYLKTSDANIGYYRQGKTRRGSLAVYMDVNHPDIVEFVRIRVPSGGDPERKVDNRQSFHNAVNITKKFMMAVVNEKKIGLVCPHTKKTREFVDARELWENILETRILTGEPYLHFIDVSNDQMNEFQKKLGLDIRGSNLCFTGDTLVATADGRNAVPIKQLAEESKGTEKFCVYSSRKRRYKNQFSENVKEGKQWVSEIKEAVAFKTGEKEVIEVFLSDGSSFKCTPDHRLALFDGEYIEAKNSVGERLQHFYTSKGTSKKYRHLNSVSNGLSKQHYMLWKYHNGEIPDGHQIDHIENDGGDFLENLQLLTIEEHLKKTGSEFSGTNNAMYNLRNPEITSNNQSAAMTLEGNGRFCGLSNEDLFNIASGLNDKGIPVTLKNMKKVDDKVPYTFSKNRFGGDVKNLRKMVENGVYEDTVIRKEKIEHDHEVFKCDEMYVVKIESRGIEEVYDLTVDDNENFNIITSTQDSDYLQCSGILVHNCSEIVLPTSEERTAVCCLSSVNLEKFDEWKETDMVRDLTRFLDNVLQYFIDWAPPSLSKAVFSATQERSLGLGAMGFHYYLQSKNIAFESGGFNSAVQHNNIMFGHIKKNASLESEAMAVERGEPNDLIGSGKRNAHLIALAPNANSSNLCNTSASIELVTSNAYNHKSRAGSFLIKNKYLEKLLVDINKDNEDVWSSIIQKEGSVQHLDFLTEEQKKVYRTAWEVDMHWVVQHAEDRQAYICQAQSLNLHFPSGSERSYVNSVHLKAALGGKVKTLYYLRTTAKVSADTVKEITRDKLTDWSGEDCLGCQG